MATKKNGRLGSDKKSGPTKIPKQKNMSAYIIFLEGEREINNSHTRKLNSRNKFAVIFTNFFPRIIFTKEIYQRSPFRDIQTLVRKD